MQQEEEYDDEEDEVEEYEDEEGRKTRKVTSVRKVAKKRTQKKTIYEIYEPSELERGHFTDYDEQVRHFSATRTVSCRLYFCWPIFALEMRNGQEPSFKEKLLGIENSLTLCLIIFLPIDRVSYFSNSKIE